MTSYHDLEKQIYEEIRASPFTRIHGKPTWRAKEKLVREARERAIKQRVSYDWAGQYGLLAEIIGAARYAADNPTLPPYVPPVQPPHSPVLPVGATAAQIRAATDDNNLLKRDWAIVVGFRRGVGENFRDALDKEFYSPLEHQTYFYVNVLPRQYIEHLEREHCPLDEPAVQELTDHFNRPWDKAGGELLPSYGTRLDEEQQQLAVDGVIITDADKHRRYMLEIYGSGVFSVETITQWTERPLPQRTHALARTFFEAKMRGIEKVQRLTGNARGGAGFSAANVAGEIQELKDTLKEAITDTVAAAIEEKMGAKEQGDAEYANTLRQLNGDNAAQKKEIADLARAVLVLSKEIRELKLLRNSNESSTSNDDKENDNPSPAKKAKAMYTWTKGMKFDKNWPPRKKSWYFREFRKKDEEGWKKWRHAELDRQKAALG